MQIRRAQSNKNLQTQKNEMNWTALVKIPADLIISIISLLINIPVMNAVWRERRELELLTLGHIRDIGLDPVRVQLECKRSFFDIPAARRKSIMTTEQADFKREF